MQRFIAGITEGLPLPKLKNSIVRGEKKLEIDYIRLTATGLTYLATIAVISGKLKLETAIQFITALMNY